MVGSSGMASHYETLGIDESASADQVRRAYLAKARELHPDRHSDAPAARRHRAQRDMQLVNEAFAVVGDTDARRRYDGERNGGYRRDGFVPSSDRDDDLDWSDRDTFHGSGMHRPGETTSAPVFHMMRSLPLLLVLGTLGGLFVFTAFASGNRIDDERRVEVIGPGDCVTNAGSTIAWVPCDGSTTGIVQAVVSAEVDCITRNGTTPRPMPDGRGFACLEPAGDSERP